MRGRAERCESEGDCSHRTCSLRFTASFTPGKACTRVSSHGLLGSRHIIFTRGVATQMIVSCARVCGKDRKGIAGAHRCWTGLVALTMENAFWGETKFNFMQHLTTEAHHRETVMGDGSSGPASRLGLHWL